MHKFDLSKLKACQEAQNYYATQDSFESAWNNCPRGDWMLWLASKLNVDIHTLTLAKAYCAKTVYHLMTDERSKDAIIVAINFGRHLATDIELKNAANAAAYYATAAYADYTAAYDAYAANAADDAAADAATYAADAATYAADAAYATYAAYDAAYAANATYTKRIHNRLKTAKICRKYLTKAVFDTIKQY